MIVLDTNVISETLRSNPDAAVQAWMDKHPRENLFLTATVAAELLLGVAMLEKGKRKRDLNARVYNLLGHVFRGRILAFDTKAAVIFAENMAMARASGRAVSVGDGQIAATALAWNYPVATRDVAAFENAGVPVINPWTAG